MRAQRVFRGDLGKPIAASNSLYCFLVRGSCLNRKSYAALAIAFLILIAVARILLPCGEQRRQVSHEPACLRDASHHFSR
jgi:hypothetical protein